MREYEKIDTLFQRDTSGTKKLIEGSFRDETVEFLSDIPWEWTEKVDGTNIRVCWDGHKVEFAGRTDKAQIPAELINLLNDKFGGERNAQIFEQLFGERETIIFGEGYGEKIQSGGSYMEGGKGVGFIVFDVLIGQNYQPRVTVLEIARAFDLYSVPVIGEGTLHQAVEFVKSHPLSYIGPCKREMEGLVCRPVYELRDRCGNRLIVKIKWADFKHLQG